MNFEEHFLERDQKTAEASFTNLLSNLESISRYRKLKDKTGESIARRNLMNELSNLNRLAVRKVESQQMYLHHLLTQPQGWFKQ